MSKHADTNPSTAPGTAYGDTRELVAEFLHDLVFGEGQWIGNEDHYRDMYREDAAEVIAIVPHLLDLGERERLATLIPALAP